ncbi:MAG TPA: hypothetical protein VG941_02495 [Candidatus Paceibacterota bacterium]|nr:hypothetical protein [Candidatus Paceibacterota bacterium]
MKAVDIKKVNQRVRYADTQKRRFWVKTAAFAGMAVAVLAGLGFALFFSGWFDIRDISITDASPEHTAQIQSAVAGQLGRTLFHVPIGRNIFFFQKSRLAQDLKNSFAFIDSISISKDFFHGLIVQATDRTVRGVWCFPDICRYFDSEGNLWGQATRSSGFLVLTVDDQRTSDQDRADPAFLPAILFVQQEFASLDIPIKSVAIPVDSFTDFHVLTADGYPIYFTIDADIEKQIRTFAIFRDQKIVPGIVHPQYLDLRFEGRVYYK